MIVDLIFLKDICVLRSIAEDAEYPTIKITIWTKKMLAKIAGFEKPIFALMTR